MPSNTTIRVQGHVGQDAEYKKTKNGRDYVTFTVAKSNGHKDKETKEWIKEPSDWYRVYCFRNLNSIYESAKKGTGVSVVDSPKYDAYISKKTGEAMIDLGIFSNDVSLSCYDKKESSGGYGGSAFVNEIESGTMFLDDDRDLPEADIPF
jgi:single-stranded DNA-binding protein